MIVHMVMYASGKDSLGFGNTFLLVLCVFVGYLVGLRLDTVPRRTIPTKHYENCSKYGVAVTSTMGMGCTARAEEYGWPFVAVKKLYIITPDDPTSPVAPRGDVVLEVNRSRGTSRNSIVTAIALAALVFGGTKLVSNRYYDTLLNRNI